MVKSLTPKPTLLVCARKKRGWTQAYVAQQVDVSVETVRQWERGRHRPYQATIQRLCDLFQMTPEELGLLDERIALPTSNGNEVQAYIRGIKTSDLFQHAHVRKLDDEKKAAWEIYVELATRISVVILNDDEGILREALSSLHALFHIVRTVLRSYGPTIARHDQNPQMSCCYLAIRMLNTTLRPLLSKWHPLLKDFEDKRPVSVGIRTYEQQWELAAELRQEIAIVRKALIDYANTFAQIAGIPSLIDQTSDSDL